MKVQIEKIKNLIIEGDLKRGLNLLLEGTRDSNFEIESILLISRFNKIEKEKHTYTLNEDVELREHNKIIISTLELLNRIANSFLINEVIIEKLSFYEKSREEPVPKENREYRTKFNKKDIRYIAWELYLTYPKVKSTLNFVIKWKMTKPNNISTPLLSVDFSLQNGWTNSWHSDSWGFKDFGKWEIGNYNIDLYR
ncbi:MAG: hypothetical protein IPM36_09555 [Lewinellaceae bacterium]|nr:hypothetical protein [Lewinellaceae bacterium]